MASASSDLGITVTVQSVTKTVGGSSAQFTTADGTDTRTGGGSVSINLPAGESMPDFGSLVPGASYTLSLAPVAEA